MQSSANRAKVELGEPVLERGRQEGPAEHQQQRPGDDQADIQERQARPGRAHKPDDDAEIDAPERGEMGRRAVEYLPDQGRERDQRHPVLAQHGAPVGHLFRGKAAQADALGLEVNLDEDAEEM